MKNWEIFLRKQFLRIICHDFSSCPYCPLNKVMCFKLISPGFFRKDFITWDLLDIHIRNPLKRPNKSGKGYFCTAKLEIYNLQVFSRPSDIKCSFVSWNFVLFRIIRTAKVYSETSQTSWMELFAKIVKSFQLLTIFIKSSILDIRLGFEYASE